MHGERKDDPHEDDGNLHDDDGARGDAQRPPSLALVAGAALHGAAAVCHLEQAKRRQGPQHRKDGHDEGHGRIDHRVDQRDALSDELQHGEEAQYDEGRPRAEDPFDRPLHVQERRVYFFDHADQEERQERGHARVARDDGRHGACGQPIQESHLSAAVSVADAVAVTAGNAWSVCSALLMLPIGERSSDIRWHKIP